MNISALWRTRTRDTEENLIADGIVVERIDLRGLSGGFVDLYWLVAIVAADASLAGLADRSGPWVGGP